MFLARTSLATFRTILVAGDATYPPNRFGGTARVQYFNLFAGVSIYGGFPPGGWSFDDRNPELYETVLTADLTENDGAGFGNNSENSYHVLSLKSFYFLGSDQPDATFENTIINGLIITGGALARPQHRVLGRQKHFDRTGDALGVGGHL